MQTDEPGDTEQPPESLDQLIEDVTQASPPEAEADSLPQDATQPGQVELQPETDLFPEDTTQPEQVELLAETDSSSEDSTHSEQAEPPAAPPRRLSRAEREAYEHQRRRFAACGRCGYFLADCRIYLGEEAIQAAMLASKDGWMRLEGDLTFHRLLRDAYGVELEAGYDYFDGSCPECRRRFVCDTLDDGATRLKIHV